MLSGCPVAKKPTETGIMPTAREAISNNLLPSEPSAHRAHFLYIPSAYEEEICHVRAAEVRRLAMHRSTGGSVTCALVRFVLVCIHASTC